ncbi:hypothetical protein M5K25_026378 [Dendrobium thyrsiflorum]|uniref:Protein kinase domain-containing protein n=1 Tax=Dendrobium thyrsiflorum TaxID=117978 RepID=A0ABD0TXB0_DENTH
MGLCYGKNIHVAEDDGGGNTASRSQVAPPPATAKGTTPTRSSGTSPWASPYPHGGASPLPAGVSPSPARSTPRKFFRRPFPPPSPAKHIKASLLKRLGQPKPIESPIPEDGGGGEDRRPERPLDKSFGYGKNFTVKYELGKEVGRGHFGHTCSARAKKGDIKGQLVAVKTISKAKMTTPIAIEDVRREVKILRALSGHPHMVKFYDACEDNLNVYIVMELCEGGELLDRILSRGGRYTEEDAKVIVLQILSVVAFCHLQGVVHRDLKPENFLFSTRDENAPMKMIDFGLSDFIKPDEKLNDIVGSAYYVAPEVLHRSYSTEADIWSIGVITYILLCGSRPFWARTESGIFRAVLRADPNFDDPPWPSVSTEAKDFVKRLLNKDYRKRMTAAQALTHPWLRDEQRQIPLDILIYKLVKSYLRATPFKRAALKALSKALTEDELIYVRSQFQLLQPSKDGRVSLDNFRMALQQNATDAMKESKVPDILNAPWKEIEDVLGTENDEFRVYGGIGMKSTRVVEITYISQLGETKRDGTLKNPICESRFYSPSTHQSDSRTSSPHHTPVTHFSASFVETNRGHHYSRDHLSFSNLRVAAPPCRSLPSLDGRTSLGSSVGSVHYDSPLRPTHNHPSQPLASPDLDPASVNLIENRIRKEMSPEPETECIHFVDANDITHDKGFFEDETEVTKLDSLYDLNPDLGVLEPLDLDTLVHLDPNDIKDIPLDKVCLDDINLISKEADLTLNPLKLSSEDSDFIISPNKTTPNNSGLILNNSDVNNLELEVSQLDLLHELDPNLNDPESFELRVITNHDPIENINMSSEDSNLNLKDSEPNFNNEPPLTLLDPNLGVAPLDLHLKESVLPDWADHITPPTDLNENISPHFHVVPTSTLDTLPRLLSPIPTGDSLGYVIMFESDDPSSYHTPDSYILPTTSLSFPLKDLPSPSWLTLLDHLTTPRRLSVTLAETPYGDALFAKDVFIAPPTPVPLNKETFCPLILRLVRLYYYLSILYLLEVYNIGWVVITSQLEPLSYKKMDFEEFCAAALSPYQLEAVERWEQIAGTAFEYFEQEGNRVISVDELAREVNLTPANYSNVRDWIRPADGKLSFFGYTKFLHGVTIRGSHTRHR